MEGTEEAEEQEDNEMEGVDHDEDEFVESVLDMFKVGTEATFTDEVNLMLMVKALSNRIIINDLENFKMFSMETVQQSLIKFINSSQVNSFEFFDNKNNERVQAIKQQIIDQKNNLTEVQSIMDDVKALVQKNEQVLTNYEEMHKRLDLTKQIRKM